MRFFLALFASAATLLTVAAPVAADPPTVRTFQDVFVDVDPCTGLDQTVTVNVVAYTMVPEHTGRATHTITTSAGYVGRGIEVGIFDDNTFIINDMLVNDATGNRIRARLIVVANPATGELQVFSSSVSCVPPA